MSGHIDPIRQETPLFGRKRREALDAYHQTAAQLRSLDAQLIALSHRRQQLFDTLRAQHQRLWTNLAKRGRQPMPDGSEALPPVPHDAKKLWGRRLRSVCLALLRAHAAPLTLVELHALLHRRGFLVDSAHPVKALADAMGYETIEGRTRRVSRGTYELVPSPPPARGRHGNPEELAA